MGQRGWPRHLPERSTPITPMPPHRSVSAEDMFTVRRLGVSCTLGETVTNINCIESMISITKHLRPGDE
jgi:hypothetical protein